MPIPYASVPAVLLGLLIGSALAAPPPPDANGERPWAALPMEQLEKIEAAMPLVAPVAAKQQRQLLVFYRTDGYAHESIPYWNHLIKAMGEKTGAYTATLSQKYDDLMPERLARFDAVFFNNTCRMKTPEPVKTAILAYVHGGKGFVGNHGAGDNWHDWPAGLDMLGGQFASHPFDRAQLKVDDPDNPITKVFVGQSFPFADELYAFRNGVDRSKLRVLISIDYPNSPGVMAACERARATSNLWSVNAANDYPISWVRRFGDGRLFYCSLGHKPEVTMNPTIAAFYLAGIQYALGDLAADDAPTKPAP